MENIGKSPIRPTILGIVYTLVLGTARISWGNSRTRTWLDRALLFVTNNKTCGASGSVTLHGGFVRLLLSCDCGEIIGVETFAQA